jgi:Xaa-Pro dipeptidase
MDPELEHWQGAFDIVDVREGAASMQEHLGGRARMAFVGDEPAGLSWGFSPEQVNPPALLAALDQERTLKTPYEVLCLTEANRRAAAGHERVAEVFRERAGECSELDLHLCFLVATGQDDADTPYKNIVAVGHHAATLDHVAYTRRPGKPSSASLLLDAGARFCGYASDISRTYVQGSDAAYTVFAELLAGMDALQRDLCERIRVGLPFEDLHEQSHYEVAALLRRTGVVRLGEEEMVSQGVTRTFYPHGLGHSLGVQTHDVGCAKIPPRPRNPYLRTTLTIAEAQVFTIEPGLYFMPRLLEELQAGPSAGAVNWPLVRQLQQFGGIRVEDDVVVTGQATARNLTREALPG